MIKRKKKICHECKKDKIIFSKGRCQECARKTYPKTVKRVQSVYPKVRVGKTFPKKTGELEIFKQIWEEREHFCYVCNSPLYVFDVWNFAHLLSNKSYPAFRLYKPCIQLLCRDHHSEYDTRGTIDKPEFDKLNELKQQLKELYYKSK